MSILVYPNGKEQVYLGEIPRGWRVSRIRRDRNGGRVMQLAPWRRQIIANLIVRLVDWLRR